jgi:hypothetical protein
MTSLTTLLCNRPLIDQIREGADRAGFKEIG